MRLANVPGVEAHIKVDGANLREYDGDDSVNGTSCTKYVEASPGTAFSVRADIYPDLVYKRDAVLCAVEIDGDIHKGKVMDAGSRGHYEAIDLKSYGRNGQVTVQNFAFAALSTDDQPAYEHHLKLLKKLGTITVTFTRVRKSGRRPVHNHSSRSRAAGEESVPEKSLKGRAISCRATLGKAKPTTMQPNSTSKLAYPYGREPFAKFHFQYRTHKDLQIEGIIPRSPSPLPLEERHESDLTREEAQELVRRLRAREAEYKTEIKNEKREHACVIDDNDKDDSDGEVDREPEGGDRKRALQSEDSGIEVVDLSGD